MTDRERWEAAWADLNLTAPSGILDAVLARYAEPHRAYHTLTHVRECLAAFDSVRALARRPAEVALALWYHDAVYDPWRADNEAASARVAAEDLQAAGAESALIDRIRGLIMATRHDAAPEPGDAALMVDVDLAVLGAAPDRFDEYERQVRVEYVSVPELEFRSGRAAILRAFLARDSIYTTASFNRRLESTARANLARSLAALESDDRRNA